MNNTSYNPKKAFYHHFFEASSISIYHAIVENKPLTMMGVCNINYLNQREREDLETVTLAYGLTTINTDQPTRISNKESLIEYIITDHYDAHSFSSFVSDPRAAHQLISHFCVFCI